MIFIILLFNSLFLFGFNSLAMEKKLLPKQLKDLIKNRRRSNSVDSGPLHDAELPQNYTEVKVIREKSGRPSIVRSSSALFSSSAETSANELSNHSNLHENYLSKMKNVHENPPLYRSHSSVHMNSSEKATKKKKELLKRKVSQINKQFSKSQPVLSLQNDEKILIMESALLSGDAEAVESLLHEDPGLVNAKVRKNLRKKALIVTFVKRICQLDPLPEKEQRLKNEEIFKIIINYARYINPEVSKDMFNKVSHAYTRTKVEAVRLYLGNNILDPIKREIIKDSQLLQEDENEKMLRGQRNQQKEIELLKETFKDFYKDAELKITLATRRQNLDRENQNAQGIEQKLQPELMQELEHKQMQDKSSDEITKKKKSEDEIMINKIKNDRRYAHEDLKENEKRFKAFEESGYKLLLQGSVFLKLKKQYPNIPNHIYEWIEQCRRMPEYQVARDSEPNLDGYWEELLKSCPKIKIEKAEVAKL